MAITLKYQGKSLDYSTQTRTKTYTYQSMNESQIDDYISRLSVNLDKYVTQPGGSNMKLTGLHKSQAEGPFWELQVQYTWEKGSGSIGSEQQVEDPQDTAFGSKSATLDTVLISVPLCAHPSYLMCWDHYLIGKTTGDAKPAIPTWHSTDTNGITASYHRDKYRWIKDFSEIPQPINSTDSITNEDGSTTVSDNVQHWIILETPTKPGRQTYDRFHYSVSEGARYATRADAGTAVKNNLNKIGSPDYDFDLDVTDWKCDNVSVRWNGEYWLGVQTWTSSIGGWDKEIYDEV